MYCGPGTVVAIATGYGLDDSGIESRWRRDFPHLSRPALDPTQPPIQWVVILGGKERPGRDVDPSHPSSAVVKKDYNYNSPPPMGRTACTEPQCPYSTAISLLTLWAVRPVQSHSACTVQLYLY